MAKVLRVLLAGSVPADASQQVKDAFAVVCDQIASCLVSHGHEFVISSERIETADRQIFDSLVRQQAKCKVTIFYHTQKSPPFQDRVGRYPNLTVEYRRTARNWADGKLPAIRYADVAMTIGGRQKTGQIAHLCPLFGKPFLPIPCFNGVSEELWRPILEYYENNGLKLPAFEHLDNWNQGSAKYAVEAVELLAGRQMFPVPHNRYVAWFTILSTVLFCVLWFHGFYGKLTSPTESFALCLAMALLIGTNVKALTGPMPRSWEDLIRSYALSLGVFFGLLLLYLYAGYSIVGDISFLEPTDKNFRRLALTLGAVAFASGYWFEDMKESLERRVKHHEGF